MTQRKKYVSANRLFFIGVIMYLLPSVCSDLMYLLTNGKYSLANIGMIENVIISQAIVIIPPLIYILLYRKKTGEGLLPFKRMGFGNLFLVLLLLLCLYPVLTGINMFSQLFVKNHIGEELMDSATNVPFGVMFLAIAVLPALVEETVYRGAFFQTYRQENVVKAAILSGAMFGLMHMNFNQFAYAFVLGVCFALIDAAVNSLHASMIMHCLYNGFSVCVLYLVPKLEKLANDMAGEGEKVSETVAEITKDSEMTQQTIMSSFMVFVPAMIVGAVLSFYLFRTLAERCGTWEKIKKDADFFESKGAFRKMISPIWLVTVVLIVILMILLEKAS